jgi:hypothetical protein
MTISAFHLIGTRDDLRDARSGEPFDAATYSLMKHGDTDAVAVLAQPLARALLDGEPELLTDPVPPVFPVAYLAVPPACLLLVRAVVRVVDEARAANGLAPSRIVRVAKSSVTTTDYATSSAVERAAELAGIGFRLTEDVSGARLVIVDDVRVTGAAESVMRAVVAGHGVASVTAAYVATLDRYLTADPSIEAALNQARIRSVTDMLTAIHAGRFVLTIRFLKRVLAAPSCERATFLRLCGPEVRRDLLDGARATGSEFCAAYADALRDLDDRAVV